MLEKPTSETFAQHLNTKFHIPHEPSGAVELELIRVTDVSTPAQTRFSIEFRAPHNPFLIQRIYRMEHEQLGALDLFLVPVSRDEDGFYYEAVFNRLNKTKQ